MGDRQVSALLIEVALDADSNDMPWVTDVNPTHGVQDDSITISGLGFLAAQGTGTVTFNGTSATVTSWSDTEIVVTVPVGATSGDIVVTNDFGDSSAGTAFTVDATPPEPLEPSVTVVPSRPPRLPITHKGSRIKV
jgi:hypothetical protein